MPKEGYKQSVKRKNSRRKPKFKGKNPGAGRWSKTKDSGCGNDEHKTPEKEDGCNSRDSGDKVTTPKKTASERKLGTKQGRFRVSLDAETPRTSRESEIVQRHVDPGRPYFAGPNNEESFGYRLVDLESLQNMLQRVHKRKKGNLLNVFSRNCGLSILNARLATIFRSESVIHFFFHAHVNSKANKCSVSISQFDFVIIISELDPGSGFVTVMSIFSFWEWLKIFYLEQIIVYKSFLSLVFIENNEQKI